MAGFSHFHSFMGLCLLAQKSQALFFPKFSDVGIVGGVFKLYIF